MKKFLFLGLVLASVILPWACSDNNNNPTRPGSTSNGTPTWTSTSAPPSTPGTPTFTVTPIPSPAFYSNVSLTAKPNGLYVSGTQLYVAEGEITSTGDVTAIEFYNLASNSLSGGWDGNQIVTGIPTPGLVPPWGGVTTTMNYPVGFVYEPRPLGSDPFTGDNGWWVLLDSSPTGTAMLYEGNNFNGGIVNPTYGNGYQGAAFNSPSAVVADTQGKIYVADTGNGCVDWFGTGCWCGPPFEAPTLHRWFGPSAGPPFIKPNCLALDSSNNLYIGDAGYSPSVVQEWSSTGTTLIGSWTLSPGCVINGLAVDNLGDFYVSDIGSGRNIVEEYQITPYPPLAGVPSAANIIRECGDPHVAGETYAFVPSCIALVGTPITNIVVGDVGNRMLMVFGP